MATNTHIRTNPVRKGSSCIVKTQGDVPQTVSGAKLCMKGCGINSKLQKVTHIDYYRAVLSAKTISNVAMLESLQIYD